MQCKPGKAEFLTVALSQVGEERGGRGRGRPSHPTDRRSADPPSAYAAKPEPGPSRLEPCTLLSTRPTANPRDIGKRSIRVIWEGGESEAYAQEQESGVAARSAGRRLAARRIHSDCGGSLDGPSRHRQSRAQLPARVEGGRNLALSTALAPAPFSTMAGLAGGATRQARETVATGGTSPPPPGGSTRCRASLHDQSRLAARSLQRH